MKSLTYYPEVFSYKAVSKYVTDIAWYVQKFVVLLLKTLQYISDCVMDTVLRQPMVDNLQNKCVFVTGCDSGFGNLLVKKLDANGISVVAACLSEEGAAKLMKECSNRVQTVQLNVMNSESVTQAVEYVRANLPPNVELWGVVNNAGVASPGGPCEFATKEDFAFTFGVNVYGLADVSLKFLPLLKKSKGRIVNIASIAGRGAMASGFVYTSSKFAVEGISDAMRREMKPWGISVHILEPWYYKTPIADTKTMIAKRTSRYESLPESIRNEYGQEWLEQTNRNMAVFLDNCQLTNLNEVVDAYYHALFAKYPKTRYAVGKNSQKFICKSMLPDYLSDEFLGYSGPLPQGIKKGSSS